MMESDLSFFALFWRASLVVQLVMILLLVASFQAWAIIIRKLIAYRKARAEAAVFDEAFWSGEPLDELYEQIGAEPDGSSEKIFAAGMLEWRRSHRQDGALIAGAQARIDRSMDVAINKEAETLNRGLSFLATVGSTAPFIGLFGTVWGIMRSFIEIAGQQSTNLAVVAPGIAEALIATAIGLFAAIPATIFYNYFLGKLRGVTASIDLFAAEYETDLRRLAGEPDPSQRAARA